MGGMAETNRDFSVLGIDTRRTFVTRAIGGDVVGITRATASYPLGPIAVSVPEDAFFLSYQRRRVFADLFLEGRNVPVPGRSDERITVHDMRGQWQADFSSPFDTVGFHLPRRTLEGLRHDLRRDFTGELSAPPGECIDDPVIRALAEALMPAFLSPVEPEPLFVDHVGWAFATHVAVTYGGASVVGARAGRLSARQEVVAKAMIDARLQGGARLAELAAACNLSVGHFARAFRATTGMTPHQWLQRRRVDRARAMLLDGRIPLTDVALACGFCDQSHLSRVFAAHMGAPPGRWRAARLD